jgi:tyrosyl-DNA phosphodiesterase-1
MKKSQQKDDTPIFQMPYDLPPTPYTPEDTPFVMDYLQEFLKTYRQ